MKVDKYLKEQAEKDLQTLATESDEKFKRELVSSVPPKRRGRKVWLYFAAATLVVAIVLASVALALITPDSLSSPVFIEGYLQADSDLNELNADLSDIIFIDDGFANSKVFKTYGVLSSKVVYYTVRLTYDSIEAFFEATLMFIVNEEYDYDDSEIAGAENKAELCGKEFLYSLNYGYDENFGLPTANFVGMMYGEHTRLAVTQCKEYLLDEEPQFLSVLQKLVVPRAA